MIKGRTTVNGRPCVVIGLSRLNCERLLDNKPILFDGAIVGLTGTFIAVLGGEAEPDILEDLRSLGGQLT